MIHQPLLFAPFDLKGIKIPNRVVISPMCQYSANDGFLDTWHKIHLGRFVMGGAGIVFTEATAVNKSGRITHGCPGLWSDSQVAGHAAITSFARSHGSIPALQLAHAGRKAGMQRPWHGNNVLTEADFARGDMPWPIFGPSPLPVDRGWPVPSEMTKADINNICNDFASSAKRALQAGYEIVEVHGAHGYLLHSFLSPLSNQRSDAYGGSLKKRMRLPLEVTEAVRAAWPENRPLFFRISAVDGTLKGWQLADTICLAKELKGLGVDVIDCSSGGISGSATAGKSQKIQPGFQVPYAAEVREKVKIPTMSVGLITHPIQAELILQNKSSDLVAIGREALANPNWPLHARETLCEIEKFDHWPKQSGWWLKRREKSSELYKAKS